MAEKNVGELISKRAMYSRGDTDEEKSKQKKEWRKRKHERRKKNSTKNSSTEMPVEERNEQEWTSKTNVIILLIQSAKA